MSDIHRSSKLITTSGISIDLNGNNLSCPVCGTFNKNILKYKFSSLNFDIVKCSHCNTMHLSPIPSPETLSMIYNNNYYLDDCLNHGYLDYSADKNVIEKTYKRRLNLAKYYLDSFNPQTILEIGAALGYGLSVARNLFNCNILASDISNDSLLGCRAKGFKAFPADYRGISMDIEPASIDMVYAFDVIEHLSELNPFLEWIYTVLKPGGILLITTPDMNHVLNKILGVHSPSIKIPQHVIYFTSETLISALSPYFNCLHSSWDYQYILFSDLLCRLANIFNLPMVKRKYGMELPVPNGMRVYVFGKKCK